MKNSVRRLLDHTPVHGVPAIGVPGLVIRGCAPIVGVLGVVRNAECGPAPGFRGRVVGRVAEVESIGVRGCTRPPVLDFRLTGGVSVAARAASATSMWPLLTGHDPPGGLAPRFRGCPPMVGATVVVRNAESRPGPGVSWLRWWSSSGGRVHRCARVYSTTGTRLPPRRRRHGGCVCWPRDLYVAPSLQVPPHRVVTPRVAVGGHQWWEGPGCPQCGVWLGPGIRGWTPMVGGVRLSAMRSLGPAPGYRGCVVGRVAQVESNGIRGCTRPPVLDFRPAGGVSVAACADRATPMPPLLTGRAPRLHPGRGLCAHSKAPATRRGVLWRVPVCVKLLGRR